MFSCSNQTPNQSLPQAAVCGSFLTSPPFSSETSYHLSISVVKQPWQPADGWIRDMSCDSQWSPALLSEPMLVLPPLRLFFLENCTAQCEFRPDVLNTKVYECQYEWPSSISKHPPLPKLFVTLRVGRLCEMLWMLFSLEDETESGSFYEVRYERTWPRAESILDIVCCILFPLARKATFKVVRVDTFMVHKQPKTCADKNKWRD